MRCSSKHEEDNRKQIDPETVRDRTDAQDGTEAPQSMRICKTTIAGADAVGVDAARCGTCEGTAHRLMPGEHAR